ncbi:hypothetical protein ACS0TY_007369 [Phlomoides rotata]
MGEGRKIEPHGGFLMKLDVWIKHLEAVMVGVGGGKWREGGVEINRGSQGAVPPVEAHQYMKETSHTPTVKVIDKENKNVKAIILKEGSPVQQDLRWNRVWVWVNDYGAVTRVPRVG